MKKVLFTMRKTVAVTAFIVSASVVLFSCLKDRHDDDPGTYVAGLMGFNLAPDQSSIEFALSGNSLTNVPVGYTSYTGGYASVYPGQRDVDVYDAYSFGGKIATTLKNFEPGKYYSVFFMGVDSNYKNVVVPDNIDTLTAASGKALIRYVNAIPDSVAAPVITIAAGGSNVVNKPATYTSVSAFIPVTAGETTIVAKNNNGVDISRKFTTEEKKIYTVLLLGMPGSTAAPVEIKYITNGTLDAATAQAAAASQPSVIK